jgi:predicted component of type VI protein secretion system
MIARALRNVHDREQAALKPNILRTEEMMIAPYRENMEQTLKEQANFMRSVALLYG